MNGVYVVLIGPFGVGKSSLAKALTNDRSGRFRYEVEKQVTTRKKRQGEDDFEYEFVSKAEFEQNKSKYLAIQPNRGVDWHYALQPQTKLADDTVHLYIVLPETAEFLKKQHLATIICAILPPSDQELQAQLRNRDSSISDSELDLRLSHLNNDIAKAKKLADLVYYNKGNLNDSAKGLRDLIENYLIKNRGN